MTRCHGSVLQDPKLQWSFGRRAFLYFLLPYPIVRQECRTSLHYRKKLDGEDKGGVGRDGVAGAMLAISQVVRDIELVFCPDLHQLDALGPSCYNLTQTELGRLVAAVGGVKDGAVDECTLVVAADGVGSRRTRTGAFVDDLILQTTGGGDNATAFAVLGEESLAVGLGSLAFLGGLGLLECLHLGEETVQYFLRLAARKFGLTSLKQVADSVSEIIDIKARLQAHFK